MPMPTNTGRRPTVSATAPRGRAARPNPEKLSMSSDWTRPWYSGSLSVRISVLFIAWNAEAPPPMTNRASRASGNDGAIPRATMPTPNTTPAMTWMRQLSAPEIRAMRSETITAAAPLAAFMIP